MFKNFLLPIISGVIGSLIANWLTLSWSGYDSRERWIISGIVGIVILVAVALIPRFASSKARESATRFANDLSGDGGVEVKGNELSTDRERLEAANRLKSKNGKVIVEDNKVRHKG